MRSHRKQWAELAYWLGVLILGAVAMTAWGGIGIAIGAFIPLPFSVAAMLNPSRFNVALALVMWGAWLTALGFILA
jgi:hypothetical protein